MMGSPSSSSSSSKHTRPVWKPAVKLNAKRLSTIDDYINSYLTTNLLKPHLNKSAPIFCQPVSDGETSGSNRFENHQRTRTKNKTEAEKINELAKEMDRMLSKAKSKRQTNDLLQLFKNTLSNFIVSEHPMDGNVSLHKTDLNVKQKKRNSLPTTPTYRQQHYQHYHHRLYRQHKSPELNDIHPSEQNVFSDRETSMTMTTTMTRCEIKDPKVSIIEASKTNILHRCYGKQSVKALPQMYKNRKKNTANVTNCQKPPSIKTKPQKLSKLQQQQRTSNQQTKTIYENDQYEKSEELITDNYKGMDEIMTDNSLSISSIDSDKQSAIERQISNEMIENNSNKNVLEECIVSKTTGIRKRSSKLFKEKNDREPSNRTVSWRTDINTEQDNSIVQRLTSFWNKKLNMLEPSKSITDQSSVTSSLVSVFEEEYDQRRRDNLNKNDEILSCDLIKSEENLNKFVRHKVKDKNVNDGGNVTSTGGEKKSVGNILANNETEIHAPKDKFIQNTDTDLPDLKMGLMNELIKVLQNRDERVTGNKKLNNDEAVCENINDNRTNKLNSDIDLKCANTAKSEISVNINDTGDESSDFDIDNYDDEGEDFAEQCDDKTLEAIEKYLLDNEKDDDVKIYLKEQTQDSAKLIEFTDDNHNECKSGNSIQNSGYDEQLTRIGIESNGLDISESKTVITNVNSIINDLKELIQTIESIPDELKSVDMNLNSLPLPDKIRNKLSTLIVPCNEAIDNELSTVSASKINETITPIEQKQLFRSYSSGRLLGYTKREGYIYMLHFPKILTIPLLENVKNPIQKVLFPRRNEFLKMMKNKSFIRISRSSEMINKQKTDQDYAKILNECIQNESNNKKETQENSEEKLKTIEENLIYNSEYSEKEIDQQIIETNKSRTSRPSIMYVTSEPSCTITTLESFNECSDNSHAEHRNADHLFKPPAILPHNDLPLNLNTGAKNNVQFQDHSFIANNTVCNKNSVEDLADRITGVSCCRSNCNQPEELNTFTINGTKNLIDTNNCYQIESSTCDKESRMAAEENTLSSSNDLSALNSSRRYNSNVRRRRYRLQNHIEDETGILAGGSGDSMQNCGDVIMATPIPCHNTSSMSVVVSNSINDSNSQTDINIVESELNLSKLRIYGHGHCSLVNYRTQPAQDSDTFSTCGVIQEEQIEEQISDIDDCVMIDGYNNKNQTKPNSYGTLSSTSIISQNINLSDGKENKKDSLGMVSSSNSLQNIHSSCNHENKKTSIDSVSSSSIISQNMNSSSNLDHDVTTVMSQDIVVNGKNSDELITGKLYDQKFSQQNLKITCDGEAESNILSCQKIKASGAENELELKSCDTCEVNEKQSRNQFLFQNLKNLLREETESLTSQTLSNDHKNIFDNTFPNQSTDSVEIKIGKDQMDVINPQSELKFHVSSLSDINNDNSSNNNNCSSDVNNLIITNLVSQSVNCDNDVSDNNCCDCIIEDDPSKEENIDNVNSGDDNFRNVKSDFYHNNYQTFYFGTDISKEAELVIANNAMKNTSFKNDLETILENDAVLKTELSKIISIDKLCEREKQLIAECICLMNLYNKPSPLFNLVFGNLSLNSSLTSLWNVTSKTMCKTMQLAKKSLIPYDFHTNNKLYRRCCKRLLRTFYTLFVSLILICIIQKNFFGIILPINFPW